MPTFFPQVSNSYFITQVPYRSSMGFDTTSVDLESGMRFASGRRGTGMTGYPVSAIVRFAMNFPMLSDGGVEAARSFFHAQRGRWGRFSILDPMGNLIWSSENFSDPSWSGAGVSGATDDPWGHQLATTVGAGTMETRIASIDGGMLGFLLCASVWVRGPGQTVFVGFSDGSTRKGYVHGASDHWRRVEYSDVVWGTGPFNMIIEPSGQVDLFGAMVSPGKGAAGYTRSPDYYGYHEFCRFDVDDFQVDMQGPGQNSLQLPCAEYWTGSASFGG